MFKKKKMKMVCQCAFKIYEHEPCTPLFPYEAVTSTMDDKQSNCTERLQSSDEKIERPRKRRRFNKYQKSNNMIVENIKSESEIPPPIFDLTLTKSVFPQHVIPAQEMHPPIFWIQTNNIIPDNISATLLPKTVFSTAAAFECSIDNKQIFGCMPSGLTLQPTVGMF
ncbi:hypothetical protein RFI_23054 [Reticulomyxa filosa]|uniref:Uncharacterized protein n=1 Tax=Reticulomyxa filosa TaxID=46433 RepID=X6ML17_RETFI|nr:hypothetical protein RFI_23054 [Reticulomyxa filosa]|eukprot:ETO14321.1 hypothetical protein RFI_23054 [Reticulomyxa filosa]